MSNPTLSQILIQAQKDREDLIKLREAVKHYEMQLYLKDKEILVHRNDYFLRSKIIVAETTKK